MDQFRIPCDWCSWIVLLVSIVVDRVVVVAAAAVDEKAVPFLLVG